MWQGLLTWIEGVPNPLVYLALGAGAAMENVVPAIPADTFVVLGGFLAAVGDLHARWVFVSTWVGNVASAMVMVWVGRTHGSTFFEVGWGRRILNTHQMKRMTAFYARFGRLAIFLSRFLPGLRAVVPVFAGITRQPLVPVAVPLALASAIWYGALVWAGTVAGHNLDRVLAVLGRVSGWLLIPAVLAGGAALVWWWRTRHHE
ncbi:MAG TPA: DedA family protein [Longimicrobiales bacterium]|nr:DedA family protein [Longimicrobiales bacterium]